MTKLGYLWVALTTAGCQLLVDFDRSQIDAGTPVAETGVMDRATSDTETPESGGDVDDGDGGGPEGGDGDGGAGDGSTADADTSDTGMPDAGMPDAGMPDAGMPDAGVMDAMTGDAEAGMRECDDAADCNDRNDCTSDSCVDGRCRREPRVGMSCDDGAFCTVMDACNAMGMCVGMARDCSDELACTTDRCNEAANRCEHTVTDGCLIDGACVAEGERDPSNLCRACLPAMSRTAYSDRPNGTSCDDGVACTNDDRCMGGTCAGMDACAPQTCNRSTGTCM